MIGCADFEELVDDYCYGVPITENEEEGYGEIVMTPGISSSCPENFEGWQINWGYCTEFRSCKSDGIVLSGQLVNAAREPTLTKFVVNASTKRP